MAFARESCKGVAKRNTFGSIIEPNQLQDFHGDTMSVSMQTFLRLCMVSTGEEGDGLVVFVVGADFFFDIQHVEPRTADPMG